VFRCAKKGKLEESEIREMEVWNAESVDAGVAGVVAEPETGVEVVGVGVEAEALECR
jgi:hypothetical protein